MWGVSRQWAEDVAKMWHKSIDTQLELNMCMDFKLYIWPPESFYNTSMLQKTIFWYLLYYSKVVIVPIWSSKALFPRGQKKKTPAISRTN